MSILTINLAKALSHDPTHQPPHHRARAAMTPWIEFHLALRDHWKIHRLKDRLEIVYPHALGLVACLWTWAGSQAGDGYLDKFTDAEISAAARWEGDAKTFKSALEDAKLIDANGRLHDWSKHGLRLLKSSRKRQKQYRRKLRNGDVTVTSTKPFIPNQTKPNQTKQQQGGERVEIPADLEGDREWIEKWLAYKKEMGKGYKPTGLEAFLKRVREIPQAKRKAAFEHSMSNGYAGLFEPKGDQSGKGPGDYSSAKPSKYPD